MSSYGFPTNEHPNSAIAALISLLRRAETSIERAQEEIERLEDSLKSTREDLAEMEAGKAEIEAALKVLGFVAVAPMPASLKAGVEARISA